MTQPRRIEDGAPADAGTDTSRQDEVPVQLDLLRADLYRLLDRLVRARPEDHRGLIREFERVWDQLKAATAADP